MCSSTHLACKTVEALQNLNHTHFTASISRLAFFFFALLEKDLKGNHYTSDDGDEGSYRVLDSRKMGRM